jgi:hypothetical protein
VGSLKSPLEGLPSPRTRLRAGVTGLPRQRLARITQDWR